MAAKLKNCPFCGSPADEEVILDGSDLCRIYCTNPDCGAEISMVKNLFRNRLLWNRRQGTKKAGLTVNQQLKPKMPSLEESVNECVFRAKAFSYPEAFVEGLKDMYKYIARHFGH